MIHFASVLASMGSVRTLSFVALWLAVSYKKATMLAADRPSLFEAGNACDVPGYNGTLWWWSSTTNCESPQEINGTAAVSNCPCLEPIWESICIPIRSLLSNLLWPCISLLLCTFESCIVPAPQIHVQDVSWVTHNACKYLVWNFKENLGFLSCQSVSSHYIYSNIRQSRRVPFCSKLTYK